MEQIISKSEQLPDAVLVQRIIGGETKLFEQVIRRYNQRLFRTGMAILNNDTEVEDAMQCAYIKAYEHFGQFENRSSFSTWLTRIMINECLAQKKKKQRYINEMEKRPANPTTKITPVHVLVNKELNSLLENAIGQLPEKYRFVFVLREIEDMSVKETSDALCIEETNVKVRLNRAKTMLRESLKGYMKDNVYNFHLSRCDRMVINVFTSLNLF